MYINAICILIKDKKNRKQKLNKCKRGKINVTGFVIGAEDDQGKRTLNIYIFMESLHFYHFRLNYTERIWSASFFFTQYPCPFSLSIFPFIIPIFLGCGFNYF